MQSKILPCPTGVPARVSGLMPWSCGISRPGTPFEDVKTGGKKSRRRRRRGGRKSQRGGTVCGFLNGGRKSRRAGRKSRRAGRKSRRGGRK